MKLILEHRPTPGLLELFQALSHGLTDPRVSAETHPCGDRATLRADGQYVATVYYLGNGQYCPGADLAYQTDLAGCASRLTALVAQALGQNRAGRAAAKRVAQRLNRIIATRNLYRGSQRYVFAESRGGEVTVENLQTGAREAFVLSRGGWSDGYGRPITEEDLK